VLPYSTEERQKAAFSGHIGRQARKRHSHHTQQLAWRDDCGQRMAAIMYDMSTVSSNAEHIVHHNTHPSWPRNHLHLRCAVVSGCLAFQGLWNKASTTWLHQLNGLQSQITTHCTQLLSDGIFLTLDCWHITSDGTVYRWRQLMLIVYSVPFFSAIATTGQW